MIKVKNVYEYDGVIFADGDAALRYLIYNKLKKTVEEEFKDIGVESDILNDVCERLAYNDKFGNKIIDIMCLDLYDVVDKEECFCSFQG